MTDALSHLPRYTPLQWQEHQARQARQERMRRPLPGPQPLPAPDDLLAPRTVGLRPGARHAPSMTEVQRTVCAHLGIALADLTGASHERRHVRPRQISMYICRTLLGRTDIDTARRHGGRDHTTAMHAVKTVTGLIANDPVYARVVADIMEALAMTLVQRPNQPFPRASDLHDEATEMVRSRGEYVLVTEASHPLLYDCLEALSHDNGEGAGHENYSIPVEYDVRDAVERELAGTTEEDRHLLACGGEDEQLSIQHRCGMRLTPLLLEATFLDFEDDEACCVALREAGGGSRGSGAPG